MIIALLNIGNDRDICLLYLVAYTYALCCAIYFFTSFPSGIRFVNNINTNIFHRSLLLPDSLVHAHTVAGLFFFLLLESVPWLSAEPTGGFKSIHCFSELEAERKNQQGPQQNRYSISFLYTLVLIYIGTCIIYTSTIKDVLVYIISALT